MKDLKLRDDITDEKETVSNFKFVLTAFVHTGFFITQPTVASLRLTIL